MSISNSVGAIYRQKIFLPAYFFTEMNGLLKLSVVPRYFRSVVDKADIFLRRQQHY
jgi:hypothetical protein